MSVPYLGNALRGWVKLKEVYITEKKVVNHQTVTTETKIRLKINKQPTPRTVVNRKPEEQRSWKWWNILVQNGRLLNIDDKIKIDNKKYVVMSIADWSESGFQNYETIEAFE
jgi:hypothetical protein